MPHGPWLESFFTTASVRWWGDTLIKWILFGLTDWMTSATGPDQEALLSHDISSACVIGGHLGIICSLTGQIDAKLWSILDVCLFVSRVGLNLCLTNWTHICRVPWGTNETRGHWNGLCSCSPRSRTPFTRNFTVVIAHRRTYLQWLWKQQQQSLELVLVSANNNLYKNFAGFNMTKIFSYMRNANLFVHIFFFWICFLFKT